MPVLLILLESFLFIGHTTWEPSNLLYYSVLWMIRFALAPLIILYTYRFWAEPKKVIRLALSHILGFMIFSIAQSTIGFFLLRELIISKRLLGASNYVDGSTLYYSIIDNTVSVNVVVYISTVAICYVQEYARRALTAQQQSSDLEKLLVVSRLELLKSQLNTHFLFNVLHTISSLVVRKQILEANTMLIKLSDLLRFSLRENNEPLICLKKEAEVLQLYLDIQQMRFKERLLINLDVPAKLNNTLVPPMILQPLVENSIKYGIEQDAENGGVEIKARSNGDKLVLTVSDTGKIPFKQINFESGIGLSNTKERLQKLFKNNYLFTIRPNRGDRGVTVLIQIPLQYQNESIYENTYS